MVGGTVTVRGATEGKGRETSVNSELCGLTEEVSNLTQQAVELEKRLQCVLNFDRKDAMPLEDDIPPGPSVGCELANKIADIRSKMALVSNKLQDVYERLEV